MASANPLEDQVTCSVCCEVYKEPCILRECFHTFCLPCINQLEKRGKVPCPECRTVTDRKHVKKDFKIQGVIDALKQQRDDAKSIVMSNECGMCHKPDRTVKYHCTECEHFMCQECEETHKGMKVCKTHTVKSITKIFKVAESKFKEIIEELEQEKRNIKESSDKIDKDIVEVIQSKSRQVGQVKLFTEDVIKELRENEKQLEKMIQDANDSLVRNLETRKQFYSKGQDEIQRKIIFLNGLIQGQVLSTVNQSTEQIKASMKISIQEIKSSLPDVQSDVTSPVSLKKGENWDVKGCIEVKLGHVVCDRQTIEPVLQSLFPDLCRNRYSSKLMELDYSPQRLYHINSDIWCVGCDNKIRVYNYNCQEVKTIEIEEISDIRGLTQAHNNQIIVACEYEGLHQLDMSGQYQKRVIKGCFSDVCVYGEHLYALEHDKCKIMVFEYQNKWARQIKINLCYTDVNESDQLCVDKNNIYIYSEDNSCIYICNFQGQVQDEIKECDNSLSLCGVDKRGNILVGDNDSEEIKVYDREGRSWHVVPLRGRVVGFPNHALVGVEESIWVATMSTNRLLRFSRKDR